MNCHNASHLMHDYLDDDIDEYSDQELFKHLRTCSACKTHFEQLKLTDHYLSQLPLEKVSSDFTNKVLSKLPSNKNKNKIKNWFIRHPISVAASIFLLLFAISLFSYISPTDQLKVVSGTNNNLVINGNEVIVPEGKEVVGDLIIENGNIQIKGEVKGNVTVINGKILMADASNVDGKTKQIDQFFEKLWYQIKQLWNRF